VTIVALHFTIMAAWWHHYLHPWKKSLFHNKIFSLWWSFSCDCRCSSWLQGLEVIRNQQLDVDKALRVTYSILRPSPAELVAYLQGNSQPLTSKHTVQSRYIRLVARILCSLKTKTRPL